MNAIFTFFSTEPFHLSYCPHRLETFTELVKEVFGQDSPHEIFGDFQVYVEGDCPAFFIHVIQNSEISE